MQHLTDQPGHTPAPLPLARAQLHPPIPLKFPPLLLLEPLNRLSRNLPPRSPLTLLRIRSPRTTHRITLASLPTRRRIALRQHLTNTMNLHRPLNKLIQLKPIVYQLTSTFNLAEHPLDL
ncbi:uncharacterized protein MYCGRDRAFT_105817 [Zymoseptoria tritici IPO323]|uniref:Uncharacterized protein n=1 Tax=Zymoseptoria tritici (strain CBS 115943 / IPO323) TaxID=336722 RepID=F9XKI2_ZYMTI|nr:uncharacterized protein MYCGRDRAFT_105817 [Zymoseptoria tritici IPO323]EGP84527.1 hypothetical protein MYCGRDRAFT_105817 [Zymoseptoria tritici IPO323]